MKLDNKTFLITLLMFSHYTFANKNTINNDAFKEPLTMVYKIEKRISVEDLASLHHISIETLNKLNNNAFMDIAYLDENTFVQLPFSHTKVQLDENLIKKLPDLSINEQTKLTQKMVNKTPFLPYIASTTDENIARLATSATQENWHNLSGSELQKRSESYIKNQIQSEANKQINQTAHDFLGRFGKAEVNVSIDADGKLQSSALKMLNQLYDDESSLIFSQVGIHEQGNGNDSRTIGNFGLGYRDEIQDSIIGFNAFLDHDFTGHNTRLGLGGEYWMDNVKLSSNLYTPLSNWKESSILKNYEKLVFDERPAKGFDIRAQGYLPNYPHLGGSLVYEHYFGDEVALFSTQDRQKDPYAFTLGLDYTPIPLVTADVSHKMGKQGLDDTRFGLNLKLQLGVPFEEQIDPNNVGLFRSLKGSRYDFVDRNYDIVFEYRQENFEIKIDGPTTADVNQPVVFNATYASRSEIKNFKWIVIAPTGARKEPTALEGNHGRVFSLMPNIPGSYKIQLEVTTQRGYVGLSNEVILEVDLSLNSEIVAVNSQAYVVDSISLEDREVVKLPKENRVLIDFYPKDAKGNLVTIDDPQLLWRYKGTQEWQLFDSAAFDRGIWSIAEMKFNSDNLRYWRFHIIADSRFEQQTVEFMARSEYNLDLISGNYLQADFIAPQTFQLDPEHLIFELYQVAGPGSSYQGEPKLILKSRVDEDAVIELQSSEAIYVNSYYELVVTYHDQETGESLDVTDWVEQSIKWRYVDPRSESSSTINNLALSRCDGYPIFATQITNYENNHLAFGDLLSNAVDEDLINEQQLRLVAHIDYQNLQQNKPVKQGMDRICYGEKNNLFEAQTGYVGFNGETKVDRVAAIDNRKAGAWK